MRAGISRRLTQKQTLCVGVRIEYDRKTTNITQRIGGISEKA